MTQWSRSIVTTHVGLVPVQSPAHCSNTHPGSGIAVNVTFVPARKSAEQLPLRQSIPAGTLVTVPLPVTQTERRYVDLVKFARTDRSRSIPNSHQLSAPEQSRPQRSNCHPAFAVAVRFTSEPLGNSAEQAPPVHRQSIPDGTLVTIPLPETQTERR